MTTAISIRRRDDPQAATCGDGRLRVAADGLRSRVLNCSSRQPLRLLCTRRVGPAVWAYASSFGGGMVSGDQVRLAVTVDADARLMLGTQAGTKIYRAAGEQVARQTVTATVADGGLLALLPQPVACFSGARYEQDQVIDCAPGASLVFSDACTGGRLARGERWAGERFSSRTLIRVDGRELLCDATRLAAEAGLPPLAERLAGWAVVGLLVFHGPLVSSIAERCLQTWQASPSGEQDAGLVAVAPLPGGGCLLRAACRQVEDWHRLVARHCASLAPLLGGLPWERIR